MTNGVIVPTDYKYGFSKPENYVFKSRRGLDKSVVEQISEMKNEPKWVREARLRALEIFWSKKMPTWGADLSSINFDDIYYYIKPTDSQKKSWDDLPKEIKDTYDAIGIPEAERKLLAGVTAQYECITGDALVFGNPSIMALKDIKAGTYVYALNEATKELEKQKVLGLEYKGKRHVFKLKVAGRTIRCTFNHPLLTLKYHKDAGKKRGKFWTEWEYLQNLKVGDFIAITKDIPDGGKPYELPTVSFVKTYVGRNQIGSFAVEADYLYTRRQTKLTIPKVSSDSLLWLVGLYLGDGYVHGNNLEIAIPKKEKAMQSRVRQVLWEVFNYNLSSQKDPWRIKIHSIPILELFTKLGLRGNARTKRVPDWVFKLPKSQKLAIIAGCTDSDGYLRNSSKNCDVWITSVNYKMLEQLHMLALSSGLHATGIHKFRYIIHGKESDRIAVGYRLQITGDLSPLSKYSLKVQKGFVPRKFYHTYSTHNGSPLTKYVSDQIGFARIKEIIPDGEDDVYDIEVEGHHNFIANGILVHNSESVYHSFKKKWEDRGVIFLSMDSGLRQYPDLVKQYFGRAIPAADNKFASLNSAVWSGGSFIYVPPGISVDIPLQAYFRINAANMGQFERTLIIVDEGAYVHYVEGCFTKGALISTNPDYKPIEDIKVGDRVLTHIGEYKNVYHTQVRPYSGNLYRVEVYGDTASKIEVTEEHPFLSVKRQSKNERNSEWDVSWRKPSELAKGDYLAIPINKVVKKNKFVEVEIKVRPRNGAKAKLTKIKLPSSGEFFRLVGYYLAEGSVDRGYYLHFSFNINEKEYIVDVKRLLAKVFGIKKFYESVHRKNNGVSIVVSSAKLARIFEQFGSSAVTRRIPQWMMFENVAKQRELVLGVLRGDGSYYLGNTKYGRKELFRINTISEMLARQLRDMLLRLGIVASLNKQDREKPRKAMFVVAIGGEFAFRFGKLIGIEILGRLNGKKRATKFGYDGDFAYVPIRRITKMRVSGIPVYNFSVRDDESYVAGGVAVHNCTAPVYTTDSLHAAVVEIFVKRGARCRYTTIQNWSGNVYNLVTKRAFVEEEGIMEWVDANIGCLTENAKIFTNPAGPVSIKDLKAGEWIYTTDLNSLKVAKSKVNAVVDQGVKPVFKVITTSYREIEATANHPFLVLRKTSNIGLVTLRWEKLENLKVGDWIAVVNELPDDGKSYEINFSYDQHLLKHKPTIPRETSEELMWLLGLYLGDGCMDRSSSGVARRIYFAVPPNDRARKKLGKLLKFVFDIPFTPKGISLTVNSTVLAKLFLDLGFSGTAKTKEIPNWIFSLSRREKLAFIEGYFDADGYLRKAIKKDGNQYGQIVFASANKNLLESLKLLMMSVGLDPLKISTYIKKRKLYKGKLIEYTSHYLSMNIRGNLERIIEKGEFDPALRFTRVRSIEPVGRLRVYDIEVDKTANFIANGIVVHNSKITMKYPSCYLVGRGARGEVLSLAYAGAGQHQDAGGKLMFLAPDTSGEIISKSVSAYGGRTSYRGLVKVIKNAQRVKCNVRCDALILDEKSRSDTYPTMQVNEDNVRIGHEAAVSRIDAQQLFYLMSRGLTEIEATSLIVNGFIEPIVKELPLEYAVELNRLIALNMDNAIG